MMSIYFIGGGALFLFLGWCIFQWENIEREEKREQMQEDEQGGRHKCMPRYFDK